MATPFADAILADSPTFFLPIYETSGVVLEDVVAADDADLTPDSSGTWTGGTYIDAGSQDDGDKAAETDGTSGRLTVTSTKMHLQRGYSLLMVIKKPAGHVADVWSIAKRSTTLSSGSSGRLAINTTTRTLTWSLSGASQHTITIPSGIDLGDWLVIHMARQAAFSGSNTTAVYVNGVHCGDFTSGAADNDWFWDVYGAAHSSGFSPVAVAALAQWDQELSPAQVSAHYAAFEGTGLEGTPAKVTGLTATIVGTASVDYEWDEDEDADTYQIEINAVATTGLVTTEYSDEEVEVGGVYLVRVRAVNEVGPGEWSEFVRVGDPTRYWLQVGTEASEEMYLTWQRDTIDGNVPDLEYRESGDTEWIPVEGTSADHPYLSGTRELHRVFLSGLSPATEYEWRWSTIGDIRSFRSLPASLASSQCKVVLAGDIYGGDLSDAADLADHMRTRDPDLIVIKGDWAYADGLEANLSKWDDLWDMLTAKLTLSDSRVVPMVPVIGNHECLGGSDGTRAEDAPYFYSYFVFDEMHGGAYEEIRSGDWLSLVVIDSNHTATYESDDPQMIWLDGVLAGNTAFPHRHVVFHVPFYGARRDASGRETLAPVLEDAGIRWAWQAHNHCYGRTVRIKDGEQNDADGVKYLGEGNWGQGHGGITHQDEWWFEAGYGNDNTGLSRHFWLVTYGPTEFVAESVGENGETFYTLTSEEDDPQMPPSSSSSDVIDFGYPYRLTFGIQGYTQYHLQSPGYYSPLFDLIDAMPEGGHLLWDTEPWRFFSWAEYVEGTDEDLTYSFGLYANSIAALTPALLAKNITLYPYAAPVTLRQNYSAIRRDQDDPIYISWLERQLHVLSIAESTDFLPNLRTANGKIAVNYYPPASWQNHGSAPGWARKLSANLSGVLDDNNVPFIWMIQPGVGTQPLFPPLMLAVLESTLGRQSFWGGTNTGGFDEVIAFYTQSNSWWGLANNTSLLARWNGDANGDGEGDPHEIRSLVGSSWVGNADYEDPPTSKSGSGKAFVFDGSSYINTNFTELAGVEGATINFWYKFTEAPDDERVVPIGSYGGTGASAGSLSLEFNRGSSIYEEDDVLGFMRSGGTDDIITYTQNPIANLNDGEWHMITQIFTIEGSVGATYFDGVSADSTYSSADIEAMNDLLYPLFIGATNAEGTADLHFTGSIFDVRIYDRALLLSEIADLYAGPEPINLSVPTISGKFERGEIITCSPGSWDNFNNGSLSYAYQWQRDSGGNLEFSNIDGATSSSYTLTDSDLNNSVRCMVAATNSGGNNANFNTASDYLTFVDFAINARNLQTVPSLASDIVISENGYVILSGNYRMQGKKSRSKNISDYMNSLYRRFRR